MTVVVQKADILVNVIASGEPNMSTAGAVSKAFLGAAGPQLQAVICSTDQLNVSSAVGHGSWVGSVLGLRRVGSNCVEISDGRSSNDIKVQRK